MPVYEGNSSVRPESKKASGGSKGAYGDTGQGNRTLTFGRCRCRGHWAVGLWGSCTWAAVWTLPPSTQYGTLSEAIPERRWLARSFTSTFHSSTRLDPYWMKDFILAHVWWAVMTDDPPRCPFTPKFSASWKAVLFSKQSHRGFGRRREGGLFGICTYRHQQRH